LAEDPVPPSTNAPAILAAVRDQFPREPLTLTADIKVRRTRGAIIRSCVARIAFDLGNDTPTATYTLLDAFATPLEQLTLKRPTGQPLQMIYATGKELTNAPLPDLAAPIQQSDLSWTDLTLSFLWWDGATYAGEDTFRGETCDVLEIAAPAGEAAAYARVRVWIHQRLHMILQAEGYNADGDRVRRLSIKSFKKIRGRWMLRDMEIERFPSPHKTRLTIRDLAESTLTPPSSAEETLTPIAVEPQDIPPAPATDGPPAAP